MPYYGTLCFVHIICNRFVPNSDVFIKKLKPWMSSPKALESRYPTKTYNFKYFCFFDFLNGNTVYDPRCTMPSVYIIQLNTDYTDLLLSKVVQINKYLDGWNTTHIGYTYTFIWIRLFIIYTWHILR